MLGPRKPNRNHILLLISEHEDEQRVALSAMQAAGYDEDQLVAETSERALDYLFARGDYEDSRPPALIIIDLDHTTEEGHRRLAAALDDLKTHRSYRLIPVLLLMREDDPTAMHAWYCMGVHACIARPENASGMTSMFESIRNYWSKRVILPELD